MKLIHVSVPILFFLLSLIEVHFTPRNKGSRRNTDRINSVSSKAEEKDGINRLDYVSEVSLEINRRVRPNYRYTYIKNV